MIQLVKIRKTFNQGRPSEFTAIHGLDLTLASHQMTVLKGPSGSGKTTLLSLIGCMTRPTSGRIVLDEKEITSLPERFLTEIRRSTFGFMFQQFNLIKGLTVLENVMVPAYASDERFTRLKEKALKLLETFSLSGKAASKVEWLSGGEAQRVTIARALVNDPAILIADEPTAHLDTKLSREFMLIMSSLNTAGKTVIIASHDPIVYAHDGIERIVDMRDGQLVAPVKVP